MRKWVSIFFLAIFFQSVQAATNLKCNYFENRGTTFNDSVRHHDAVYEFSREFTLENGRLACAEYRLGQKGITYCYKKNDIEEGFACSYDGVFDSDVEEEFFLLRNGPSYIYKKFVDSPFFFFAVFLVIGVIVILLNESSSDVSFRHQSPQSPSPSLPPSLSLPSGEKHNGNDDIGSNDSGKKKDEPGVEGVRKIVL